MNPEEMGRQAADRRRELKAEIARLIEKNRPKERPERVGYTSPDERRAEIVSEWKLRQEKLDRKRVQGMKAAAQRHPAGAKFKLICSVCGKPHYKKRSHARACSDACRTRANRRRRELEIRLGLPGAVAEMIGRHAGLVSDARRAAAEVRWTSRRWAELFDAAAAELEGLSRRAAELLPENVTEDAYLREADALPEDLFEVKGQRGRRRHEQDYKPLMHERGNEGNRSTTQ